jgi:hypothetical protein
VGRLCHALLLPHAQALTKHTRDAALKQNQPSPPAPLPQNTKQNQRAPTWSPRACCRPTRRRRGCAGCCAPRSRPT